MSSDSSSFLDEAKADSLPLYEAKLIHQYDHRWATYGVDGLSRDLADEEKSDPDLSVIPRYWVDTSLVQEKLRERAWNHGWLMGWRDITGVEKIRTTIASIIPLAGAGNTTPLLMTSQPVEMAACLLANLNSLVLDYVARVKVGGIHLTFGYLKQFPILPPARYSQRDLAFIAVFPHLWSAISLEKPYSFPVTVARQLLECAQPPHTFPRVS